MIGLTDADFARFWNSNRHDLNHNEMVAPWSSMSERNKPAYRGMMNSAYKSGVSDFDGIDVEFHEVRIGDTVRIATKEGATVIAKVDSISSLALGIDMLSLREILIHREDIVKIYLVNRAPNCPNTDIHKVILITEVEGKKVASPRMALAVPNEMYQTDKGESLAQEQITDFDELDVSVQ